MIITLLKGGLGNQMFQYAVAKGCLQNGENIYLDLSFVEKHNITTEEFTARSFELDIFPNINAQIISKFSLNIYGGKSKISKKLKKWHLIQHSLISQHSHEFVDLNLRKKITYLDGFFQSEKYFKHIRNELLHDFRFPHLGSKNELAEQKILASKNATAIHIRRGDYITNKAAAAYHGVLPISYYREALELLSQKLNIPTIEVFIFTNDIEWVKNNFKLSGSKLHFIEGNEGKDSWKDMALMTACKHHIIANSSFSWWGAWLASRQGHVYAPNNWFSDIADTYSIHDLIPEKWNIVNY